MDKQHFRLLIRYRAVMKNGETIQIDLEPENTYYFREQERAYLIRAIREQDNLDINEIERIEKFYIVKETQEPVKIIIGV